MAKKTKKVSHLEEFLEETSNNELNLFDIMKNKVYYFGKSEKAYVLDIKNIVNFIFSKPNEVEMSVDYEMTETYGLVNETATESKLLNSTSREVKQNQNEQLQNVKYDLVKDMLATLSTMPEVINDDTMLSIGQIVAINTLIKYNFLKPIKQ